MSEAADPEDSTAMVQDCLDRGVPVPSGDWRCPGGVTVPGDYCERATAAGRLPDTPDGGFYVAETPTRLRFRMGLADLTTATAHPSLTKFATELGRGGYLMFVEGVPDGRWPLERIDMVWTGEQEASA